MAATAREQVAAATATLRAAGVETAISDAEWLLADVLGVPTVIVARTDALNATLITNDVDAADHQFMTGVRTAEGYYGVKGSLESAITTGRAAVPRRTSNCTRLSKRLAMQPAAARSLLGSCTVPSRLRDSPSYQS